MTEPWYKTAVIYAVDVEKFADGDGDGVGDFRGLTQRLDHIAELGATCIWLLPFYPSPRRDNGYDVSDYYGVDPRFGTLNDFAAFVHEAGERGLRVLIDIVLGHTSDTHPWFQAARRDRDSSFRRYYKWSDQPRPVPPGRDIAFPGEEKSAWTYDEVAGAYYYHPFYHFQPDLNMNEPEVQSETLRIIDFWMSFGVSGFRLDAVPLVLGLEGPLDEIIDDPHGVLRSFRAFVDQRRSGSALLGEVDVGPQHLAEYFGDGDELQMLFDFLLNNYMFESLATERSEPIVRALSHLPSTPHGTTWVNFLRNHDELNLGWLMPEDRDLVYEQFAPDEGMRIYDRGIRRRLAPMLGGDARRIETAFSLLFSMPGVPMILYGDEIGMGEDLSRPGRDAVRPIMQWDNGPNGGFSTAPADKCVRAPIESGPFGFRETNVAAQTGVEGSVLESVRDLIKLWRQNPCIGQGTCRVFETEAPEVVAHTTSVQSSSALAVHNLSGREVEAAVTLHELGPFTLSPLHGHADVRPEGVQRHVFRLPPYGYAWYRVVPTNGEET